MRQRNSSAHLHVEIDTSNSWTDDSLRPHAHIRAGTGADRTSFDSDSFAENSCDGIWIRVSRIQPMETTPYERRPP